MIRKILSGLCLLELTYGPSIAGSRALPNLESLVEQNRMGIFDDYWLAKKVTTGDLAKTALIFGYVDNRTTCEEIAEMLRQRYTAGGYVCFRANTKLQPKPAN